MLDRVWGRMTNTKHRSRDKVSRCDRRPRVEPLEGRQLLAASIAPIPTVSVPGLLGYQLALNGSGASGAQTFTASSNNPNIKVTVDQGEFVTLHVSHTATNVNDITFSGAITFQLFQDLTPNTVQEIEQFVTDGFYVGKIFHRVANQFPGPNDFIVQAGSASGNGSGMSGQPGTPFPDEFNQQLAFTGTYQVAMANAGADTNDTQFFITTSTPRFLDFGYTIFGQVVSGQSIVNDMTHVARHSGFPNTTPINPITITSATLSTTNPNGVLHIDATHAAAGQSAVITVTAHDGTTTSTQHFTVNVVPNTQVERPFVNSLPNMNVGLNQTLTFQVPAVLPTPGEKAVYTVDGSVDRNNGVFLPVANATVTLDQATGIVHVVPKHNYVGPITLIYGVRLAPVIGDGHIPVPATNLPVYFEYHTSTLTVNSNSTPVILKPIAVPFRQAAAAGKTALVHLMAENTNPGSTPQFSYMIISPPLHGTITNFNASKGTFVYTPAKGFKGVDVLQYAVNVVQNGDGGALTSLPSYVTLNVK